ncbi:hypothetical protein [Streptomyces sp. NPDC006739]|uniref:hypothetical protein n=1 Tax=Streptomyces sp. NPDC006739 TaxID=3364763 RepID=UPI0036CF66B0
MTRHLDHARRLCALIAAGMLSVGLVAGSASVASASTPPHAPAADAVSDGILPPAAPVQNYAFSVNGTFAEYLTQVDFPAVNELYIVRYSGAHSIIDSWLASQNDPREPRPGFVSVSTLDFAGNTLKQYAFLSPVITKEEVGRDQMALTITFDRMIIL